ncbi:MAG TPA: pyridoxamine 5'-phosphate oxidase family protein [Ktedonobacterales bacterium]|nr:pyridoxamine 5'-phosphate oxidase family protein [Ktedonobacterales bacterium]
MDEKNLDMYGDSPIPWSRVSDQLQDVSATKTYWLATVRPEGRPHIAGVGMLWVDGKLYFTSGAGTRKSRNLAENPNCAISVSLPTIDLVIEGTASRVTDQATLQSIAERYAAQGWPASASEDAITAPYSAPSAGPAPWDLYVVTPVTAFGVATAEPYGAMRWRFVV